MKIVLCGDLLFSSRNLANRLDSRIVEILQNADAAFCNAEFSTPKKNTPPGLCMYLTSVPQEIQDELADLNLRMVSFANNHTTDYGWQGYFPVESEGTWRMPDAPVFWILHPDG